MKLYKTAWPRTLAEVYSSGGVLLPDRGGRIARYRVIDVRPPQKGEYYLSVGGYVSISLRNIKQKGMTRIILEEIS